MNTVEMTRFDARLTKEQKEFFEYASKLAGFRSLTEFVMQTVQVKAEEIVEKHEQILASKRDQEIFFEAIFKDENPNDELKSAFTEFEKMLKNA